MLKKTVSLILAALMIFGTAVSLSSCGLDDIFSLFGDEGGDELGGENSDNGSADGNVESDNANNGDISKVAYVFDFEDVGNGKCVITNLRFNSSYTEPITVEFPTKSYDGRTVVGIKFLTDDDVLPRMIRGADMERIFDTIESNMEAAIAAGAVGDPNTKEGQRKISNERQELKVFKSYYINYDLKDAVNEEFRSVWLNAYPVLAVTESIYVLDESTMGDKQFKRLKTLAKKYGVTAEFIAQSNRILYNEIINSNVANKDELLSQISGRYSVRYPANVKELVLSDLNYSLSQGLYAPYVEKITLSSSKIDVKVKLSDMAALKQITTSNVRITVDGCTSLKQVDIMGDRVYLKCSNDMQGVKVIIHDSVKTIGFDVAVEDSKDGLYGDAITEIVLPNGLEKIERDVFSQTGYYKTESNWKNGVLYIGKYLIRSKDTAWGNFAVKEGTLLIADNAFNGCYGITELRVPDSVKHIGDDAFNAFLNLKALYLGNSIETIGDYAFYSCISLDSVTLPDSVRKIGRYAFGHCESLKCVNIPRNVEDVSYASFLGCSKLETITVDAENPVYEAKKNCVIEKETKTLIFGCNNSQIPSDGSVTNIGEHAFDECDSITSAVIPDGVVFIGGEAFARCDRLEEIVIPASVTDIQSKAFYYCRALSSITVDPQNPVYESKDNCLIDKESKTIILGCKSSKIPDDGSVTAIGVEAFSNCVGLVTITIPSSITEIGSFAFSNCYKLVEVINLSSLDITVGNITNGHNFVKEVHSGESKIVNVDGYLFYTLDNVNRLIGYVGSETELVLPDSYNGEDYTIYRYAFAFCNSIVSVTIPQCVTGIGENAFYECLGLERIVINEGVTEIQSKAFGNCTALTTITILNSEVSVDTDAFYGCDHIINVNAPVGVIQNLKYKPLLKTVVVTGGSRISDSEFAGCTNLTDIVISDGVTQIGNEAFRVCVSLTNVVIPNSILSIGARAFLNCDSLTEINFTGTEEQWNAIDKGENFVSGYVSVNFNYTVK